MPSRAKRKRPRDKSKLLKTGAVDKPKPPKLAAREKPKPKKAKLREPQLVLKAKPVVQKLKPKGKRVPTVQKRRTVVTGVVPFEAKSVLLWCASGYPTHKIG